MRANLNKISSYNVKIAVIPQDHLSRNQSSFRGSFERHDRCSIHEAKTLGLAWEGVVQSTEDVYQIVPGGPQDVENDLSSPSIIGISPHLSAMRFFISGCLSTEDAQSGKDSVPNPVEGPK